MASEGRGIRVCPECGQTSNTGVCPEHQRVLLPPNRRARLTSAPLLGYVLDDRYVLVDRIGGGGMSVVYAALQRPLGRLVAVKVLHAQLTATKNARDRFEREARTVSLLKSRNTVTLFDFGVSKGGAMPSVAYMVMEYVAGESLAARLKRVGAMPPADVARIVRDVGRSLHEAHQKGIVHRDMKPANVILTTVGDEDDEASTGSKELAKVIDFGIARLEDTAMTQTGILLGTPNYMAPELFEGGREVDARADVYALGVMTFQMLAGYKPFKDEGGPLGVLWHHANSPVPPLPGSETDPRLRAIEPVIRKAMGKKPEDRFPTVRAMVEAFLAAIGSAEAKLGEEEVIELSIDDIEINPEVRQLTSQYHLDLEGAAAVLGSADTSPAGPERPERPTTRRPGAALEERATAPRKADGPDRSRALLLPPGSAREAPREVAPPPVATPAKDGPKPPPPAEPPPRPRAEPALTLGPPPPVPAGPTLGPLPRPDESLDTFGESAGQVIRRRESHGFRGLLIVGALVVLGGGAALFWLDQNQKPGDAPATVAALGSAAAPDTFAAATPETGAPATGAAALEAPGTAAPEVAPEAAPELPTAPETMEAPPTAADAPDTAAPDTVAAVPATEAPERPAESPPRPLAPRTAAPASKAEGRIEAKTAAVRAALDAGDCPQARRLFRELDELPGSTAAVSGLSPALANCRAGAAPPAEVKAVVVAPDAEDAPPEEKQKPAEDAPPVGARKPARIVAGAPRVQGGLAAGDVQAALRRMLTNAPLGCIGKHPVSLSAPAELSVGLRVTAAGQLIDAALSHSTVGNPAFERCVVNSLRALEFPASKDASRIELPLKVVPGE